MDRTPNYVVDPIELTSCVALILLALSSGVVAIFHLWIYWPHPLPPPYNHNNVELGEMGNEAL